MNEKRIHLKRLDIVILSLILFAPAAASSVLAYLFKDPALLTLGPSFTLNDNIQALLVQSIQLGIAAIYLKLRDFDFKQWTFRITFVGTLGAVFLFVFVAALADLGNLIGFGWSILPDATLHWTPQLVQGGGLELLISSLSIPLVLYALLDGFYEELFFLGICTSVEEDQQTSTWLYALVVRVICHLYLGIIPALIIGLCLGCIYALLHKYHSENLYPFGLSHAIAIVVGLSILQFR